MTNRPKFSFAREEPSLETECECDLSLSDIDDLIKTIANPSLETPEDVLHSHILTTNAMLLLSLYVLKQEICKRQAITKSVDELMLFMKEMGPPNRFSRTSTAPTTSPAPTAPTTPPDETPSKDPPKKEEVLAPSLEETPVEVKTTENLSKDERNFCEFCEHEFTPYSSFECVCHKQVSCCTFCRGRLILSGENERSLRCIACLSGLNVVCAKKSPHHMRCQSAMCYARGCEKCFFRTNTDAWMCFRCWRLTLK